MSLGPEGLYEEKLQQPVAFAPEVLKKGTVVRLDNPRHPWHDQVGLIDDHKHLFYRVEINNNLVWFPLNWVKKHEPPDVDY